MIAERSEAKSAKRKKILFVDFWSQGDTRASGPHDWEGVNRRYEQKDSRRLCLLLLRAVAI